MGFGCDGTSVNFGAHGLRGHVEESIPWVVFFWCLAHRLWLSLNADVYVLPISQITKKVLWSRLSSSSLKPCLEHSYMPHPKTKENRPLCACGTWFVSHKVAAIHRFIDRYLLTWLVCLKTPVSNLRTNKKWRCTFWNGVKARWFLAVQYFMTCWNLLPFSVKSARR